MVIATFNVWHGLAGRGVLRFREFEPEDRRRERWAMALRSLAEIDPDIILLQELNPVSKRGQDLTSALGGRFAGRVDQSGLKFLAQGLPLNLATGLGVVCRRRVKMLGDTSLRLSGPGFSGESLSLHMQELRYAQLISLDSQTHGRLLVVNTHLHHGFERFPNLLTVLKKAVEEGRVTEGQYEQLMPYLDHARDRRLQEVDRLLAEVDSISGSYDGIIIGGDFNAPSEAAAYRLMELAGFLDLQKAAGNFEPTWDPIANPVNHRLQDGFQFPLPTFENPELQKVYREFDSIPRRIDFLFARGTLAKRRPSKVARFGLPGDDGLAPSDHFGVYSRWEA